MKPLEELKKQQPQILLAELAGLLHNIGKLDPNFIVQVIGAKNPQKLKYATEQIVSKSLAVPRYAYKRFSAPDASILSAGVEKVMRDFQNRKNPSFPNFCQALKTCSTCSTEIQALMDDWSCSQKTFPFTARALNAIWQFFSFASVNDGPLYFLLPDDRKNICDLNRKLSSLASDIGLLNAQVQSAPHDQKTSIGTQLNQRKQAKERVEKELNTLLSSIQTRQNDYEAKFRDSKTKVSICNESWAIADLLTLFWDKPFFYKPHDKKEKDYKRQAALSPWLKAGVGTALTALLILAHGEVSGAEKGSDDEKDSESEDEKKDFSPDWDFVCQSTAFGLDVPITTIEVWPEYRKQLLDQALLVCDNAATQRDAFLGTAKRILSLGVGDTQWPINDVDLLNYASSIAVLFKSAVAKAVLENRLPTVAEVKWRLLSIRYDGLEYLSRALHISDLLARRDALEAALDAVKAVIEVEYPLGNEIYRDENGSVLIVPHIEDGDQEIDLLALPCGDEGALRNVLAKKFSQATYDKDRPTLDGEVSPLIDLSDNFLGKQIQLPKAKGWSNPPLQPDPVKVAVWWSDKTKHADICTVCGLRPQGYGAPNNNQKLKAQDRSICWICMERRDDRSQKWAQAATSDFQKTVWVDEVTDNNGRVALVVGRFVLDGWLDGSLIPTMQKYASFARIQRCWRTTETFWKEIERALPATIGPQFRPRVTIKPRNPDSLDLGRYHTYELDIAGARLGVVWDPANQYFITCENLDYFCKVAAIKTVAELKDKLTQVGTISVYEPSAHLSRRKELTAITAADDGVKQYGESDGDRSSTYIPIFARPAIFMALVPADKALKVVEKIKEKYETEMGKVRDRLPIHVGIVYAPHRSPMRALLDAGRRMLEMPYHRERWKVKNASAWDASNSAHLNRTITFENGVSWEMPLRMGDKATADDWYPHFLTAADSTDDLKHARDLQLGDEVQVRPSRFDFEFLDVAARRNEISYTSDGFRRGLPARPLLLEDFDRMNELWVWMIKGVKKLSTSRLQHLEATLTSYINEWFNGDLVKAPQCQTFQEFAQTVLHRLDPAWWKSLDGKKQNAFNKAVSNGFLLDVLELRMHILKERPEKETNLNQRGENQ